LIDSFRQGADAVDARLTAAVELRVPLQPCLRDVWSAHILFVGAEVTGVVDFGAMRVESVAADVSRLLGSMAGGDRRAWSAGLTAYQAVRPLTAGEETLVEAFDQSHLLMAGLQWIEWVYVDNRQFDDQAAILTRIDRLLTRLPGA
jgi:homoserine kinase type II